MPRDRHRLPALGRLVPAHPHRPPLLHAGLVLRLLSAAKSLPALTSALWAQQPPFCSLTVWAALACSCCVVAAEGCASSPCKHCYAAACTAPTVGPPSLQLNVGTWDHRVATTHVKLTSGCAFVFILQNVCMLSFPECDKTTLNK